MNMSHRTIETSLNKRLRRSLQDCLGVHVQVILEAQLIHLIRLKESLSFLKIQDCPRFVFNALLAMQEEK